MVKTGNAFVLHARLLGTLALLLTTVLAGRAQNVEVKTTLSQNEVFTGERISISIEITGSGFNSVSRPEVPQMPEELKLLSRTPSTSRSFSYVNGESNITYSYTYYAVGQVEGTYKIPPVNIKVDNRSYQTNSVTIKLIDRNKARSSSDDSPSGSNRPDIYISLELSDRTPYTGQQILADVVLFFKSGLEVLSYQPVPGWKTEGFWKEKLVSNERPRARSTIIDGVRFRKAQLMQFALFPTKSGTLELSPYEVSVNARSVSNRNDAFSSFFGGMQGNNRSVDLKSEPVKIEVKSPPALANAKDIGAVGSFTISREISGSNTIVGETIEITTHIEGTGNVPLISTPEYDLPESFEIYNPKDVSDVQRDGKMIAGSRTFTNVVVARKAGSYTIPATNVAYFDPKAEKYHIKNLPEHTITVKKDPKARNLVSANQRSFTITPVLGLTSWQTSGNTDLFDLWWFWTGLITPFMLWALGYWQKTYRERMNTDVFFARSQKALDNAKAKMDEAYENAEEGDIKEAYSALHRALSGYIGDRLGLPEAGLSDEEYLQALKNNNVDSQIPEKLYALLDKCSTIRYAPATTIEDLADDVEEAKKLLGKLKKNV